MRHSREGDEPTSYSFTTEDIVEMTVLCQSGRVTYAEVGDILGKMLPAVFGYAMANGIAIAGAPMARYSDMDAEGFTVEAGLPVTPGAEET
ncbi:MAG: hypothetical protein VYE73_15125 [Acidobacteriota bacterium]|nr:hypothetical protein [Acidobacteriota bacterium]